MNHSDSNGRPMAALLTALFALASGLAVCERSLAQSPADAMASAQTTAVQWIRTGDLQTGRTGHTATRLLNGTVLVVGGWNGAHAIESAEIFDPATGSWSGTGPLGEARAHHSATLLSDGRVLVAGGFTGFGRIVTAELYDPGTGTWTRAGNVSEIGGEVRTVLLRTGRVLALSNGASNLYDPATGTWTTTGSLNESRVDATLTLLGDGRVLVAGGTIDSLAGLSTQSTELYNPDTGSWTAGPPMRQSRTTHTAARRADGSVLVIGGYEEGVSGVRALASSELYDPTTDSWSAVASLPEPLVTTTATLLQDGSVFVVATGRSFAFGIDRSSWRSTGNLNSPRNGHTATLLADGTVLVAGGLSYIAPNPGEYLRSTELYEPGFAIGQRVTGTWYDPAQPGHGIFIEVLPEGRFLAWWFTFNPGGTQQAWFGGVGTYSGATATIPQVTQGSGGRWIPNFNPAQVVNNAWGSLSFEFTDLDHGRVDFSSVAGYGSGSMNLTRLTQPVPRYPDPNPIGGAISPNFTGAWYDPAQPGHGLFLEVLPGDRLLAWWFSFDPSGTQQAWFGGVAGYYGDTAVISDVVQPTGGRWIPNFSPQQITNNPWGTLTLTFSDCAHGTAQFSSTRGYGTGTMNLARLTVPVGFACP